MEMIIDDSCSLQEIREEFSRHFPFLRLEFFRYKPGEEKIFSKENLVTEQGLTIRDIRHIHTPARISINAHQKVSTLEKLFFDDLGICVQVFRRSYGKWIQTTRTDKWTLAEQNRLGEETAALEPAREEIDFDHYREQE